MRRLFTELTHHASKWWYEPLMVALSAIDAFIPFVPNEPVLAAGVIAKPRRWLFLGVVMAIGSAVGALCLAAVVGHWSDWILAHFVSEKTLHSKGWRDSVKLINEHGWWGLALVSLGPLPQHAAVIFVGLTGMPLQLVFLGVVAGRALKYVAIAWLASHAPKKLKKWHLLPED